MPAIPAPPGNGRSVATTHRGQGRSYRGSGSGGKSLVEGVQQFQVTAADQPPRLADIHLQ